MSLAYRWQRVKTSHKQNVQETQKTVVFATSIFGILVDFAIQILVQAINTLL